MDATEEAPAGETGCQGSGVVLQRQRHDETGAGYPVYTDGINETENINKEQFGDDRLQALLQQDLGDARLTSETIHKAVEEFVGDAEPSDDLTKMCIKMK